ncbi:hypothetical protein UFOVP1382_157 [uncultured Caudovirales phage]|uniref:Uncharacterized protein n=1 Tax=uncultured Caudovirales phage TaxID=2100421 RepID=A0A6J5RXR5_9CAUD|nr:hypothetical protein UFOVP1382_157 [uncultured Caudovirales phage]
MAVIIFPPNCTPFAAGYIDGYDGVQDAPVTQYTVGPDALASAAAWKRGYSAGFAARIKNRKPQYATRSTRKP